MRLPTLHRAGSSKRPAPNLSATSISRISTANQKRNDGLRPAKVGSAEVRQPCLAQIQRDGYRSQYLDAAVKAVSRQRQRQQKAAEKTDRAEQHRRCGKRPSGRGGIIVQDRHGFPSNGQNSQTIRSSGTRAYSRKRAASF